MLSLSYQRSQSNVSWEERTMVEGTLGEANASAVLVTEETCRVELCTFVCVSMFRRRRSARCHRLRRQVMRSVRAKQGKHAAPGPDQSKARIMQVASESHMRRFVQATHSHALLRISSTDVALIRFGLARKTACFSNTYHAVFVVQFLLTYRILFSLPPFPQTVLSNQQN